MKYAIIIGSTLALLALNPAASADTVLPDAPRAPTLSVKLTDMDVLAERHLALYRVSRATALGLQEQTDDGIPVSVRNAATAGFPLPDHPISDGSDVPR